MEKERNAKENIDPKEIKLIDLGLSGYTINSLLDRGINTLGDVSKKTIDYFENIPYYRESSRDELKNVMKKYGLEFRENMLLKEIEALGLSEQIYNTLKDNNRNYVGETLNYFYVSSSYYDTESRRKIVAEVLRKMRDIGVTYDEMKCVIQQYREKEKLLLCMEQIGEKNIDNVESFIPLIAKSFIDMTTKSVKVNFRKLYIAKQKDVLEKREDREEQIKKLTEHIEKFLNEYLQKLDKETWKIYKGCAYKPSKKEYLLFFEEVKKRLNMTISVLEREKERYDHIVEMMIGKCELNMAQINKLALYFPFEIESKVCHSLIPYANQYAYIKYNEQYEIAYNELKEDVELKLEYETSSQNGSVYEIRTKPKERKCNSQCSAYIEKETITDKIVNEVMGTVGFIAGQFLSVF